MHIRLPDGASVLRPIQALPEDKKNFARERGYSVIDYEFVKEAREQFEKPTG